MREAVEVETSFAEDILTGGVTGLSRQNMREYLEFTADQRLANLEMAPIFKTKNPLPFMELQDVQELSNFFERRVSSYQIGLKSSASELRFDENF